MEKTLALTDDDEIQKFTDADTSHNERGEMLRNLILEFLNSHHDANEGYNLARGCWQITFALPVHVHPTKLRMIARNIRSGHSDMGAYWESANVVLDHIVVCLTVPSKH